MKKVIFISLLAFFALSLNTAFAQNDSIYVMRNGSVIWKYKFSDIDSIIYYNPDNINIPDTPIDTGTLITGTFTDPRDGYEYSWVQIGSQTWMAENLKYLPSVVGPGAGSYDDPYYYVYGYDGTSVSSAKATENYQTYGVLYNWSAAMQACPSGWHLPSDAEWTQLTDYLGGVGVAGVKLKATGTIDAGTGLWYAPNTDATNETGFTALPGGYRHNYGGFYDIGYVGHWWSATENDAASAWNRYMSCNYSDVYRSNYHKVWGFSVRCLRD